MSQKHRLLSDSWQCISAVLVGLLLACHSAAQPVVRQVRLDRQPIFSAEDRAKMGWLPLAWADALHVDTRSRVIQRELVFRAGEPLPEGALQESERKLRGTGFFGEVTVEAIPVAADTIDVVVRTREVWTTEVNASYERFEGQLLWAASLRERNFLGMARSLGVSRSQNDDRSTWSVAFSDRQLFDGTWRGAIGFSESDDGAGTAWAVERPFFRVNSGWGGGIRYNHYGQRPRFYLDSESYVRPQLDYTILDASVAHRIQETPAAVWRLGGGLRALSQRFSPESDLPLYQNTGAKIDTAPLAESGSESRNERIAYLQIQRATKRYAEMTHIDAMGQVEDFALGGETLLNVGWAMHAFGGSVSGLSLGAVQTFRRRWGDDLLSVRAHSDGLVTNDKAVDLRLGGELTSHVSFGHGLRLAAGALGGTGSGMDRHSLYTMGIENGLRAATYREFVGDRILRGNLELRWVHEPTVLHVLIPGLTGFVDAGIAWYERETDLQWKSFRGAMGVGLRLGFKQGSQFVPLRFDLAWPMLYDIDRQSPVLSIGTGQVF